MTLLEWKNYFQDRGIEPDLAKKYLAYIKGLQKNNCPVIFELDHLSQLLEIDLNYLARMISASGNFYRSFHIPKRSGGVREICAPHHSLLSCQRWILQNILNNIDLHPAAHGFTAGKSIKTNAISHLNSSAILKMDLENFFPSIPQAWVIQVFKEFGYAPNVSYYLSALCCCDGALAQGAATSPALSNLILRSLDKRLSKLARTCSLIYTRYADDLTFSGKRIHFSLPIKVEEIVKEFGLKVNTKKTRLKLTHGARIVTGICITNGKLSVPREYKREIKNDLFFIRKFGYLSHIANRKIKNPNYLSSLLGRISFWLFVEPTNEFAIKGRNTVLELMRS
ncbi:retron St85 family RNA-directed DNA polymerase [Herbaspirillum sp. GW103]|uniref:retron St85 family RNA-directed DNA polymerase n=1 Tax=Herbaspirillum sp. GW103 TaxID=1175306 RepID=UPI0009D92099|nr:retron St85 family RNA-directed DNA polymerase [Herbaspirillum sp. GW103]